MTTRTLELVDLSGTADGAGGTSLRTVAEALFRQRAAFLWTFGLVLLATILITALTPRRYASEMNILVRNARPDYLISPERSNGEILQHDVTEERINSEIEILRSRDVADAVVDPGFAARPMAAHSEAERKAHEKTVTQFLKHLTVEALRKSNVIHVTYTAPSATEATATVDKLLKAFLVKQREIERSTGASVFFAGEAARYKAELDQAQAQLAAYQQSSAVVSVPAAERTLDGQLTALDEAIRTTQVQITEAADRVGADRRQLTALPSRQATQQRSIPNTQAVEELTATLNNYENKRTALLARYQPSDRLVVEVNQQIADTSAALAEARTTNGQESTTDNNPVYQQVNGALASSTIDLAALKGKLADLNGQRTRLRAQLSGIEGATVEFSTLESRVAELQNDYQLYSQKKNEAQMADAMDQQQLVNVAVAENPTFSAKPASPQVALNMALGTFTALFLALCAVFLGELGRVTVANPRELELLSGLPVLATIPLLPGGLAALEARPPARLADRTAGPTAPGGWTGGEARPLTAAGSFSREPDAVKVATFAAGPEPGDAPQARPVRQAESPQKPVQAAAEEPAREGPARAEPPVRSTAPMKSLPSLTPKRPAVEANAAAPGYEQPDVPSASRAALARMPALSFEQLAARVAASPAEPVARDPKAYPMAPPRVAGAPQPRFTVVEEPAAEPAVPLTSAAASFASPGSARPAAEAERAAQVPVHPPPAPARAAAAETSDDPLNIYPRVQRGPMRSRLSPSQRAQQHRSTQARRAPDAPYVTYTVQPAGPTNSDPSPRKPDSSR